MRGRSGADQGFGQRVDFLAALRALPTTFLTLPLNSSPAPRASVPGRPVAAPVSRFIRPLTSSALPLARWVRSPMAPPSNRGSLPTTTRARVLEHLSQHPRPVLTQGLV